MNSNIKTILTIALSVLSGLFLGYLIFQNSNEVVMSSTHSTPATQEVKEAEVWTCSMHPQIRQDEPGDCPLCGMDLIPADGGSSNDPLVLEMTNVAVKLANIQTITVGSSSRNSSTGTEILRLSGKIKADERLASSQVSHVPGRIEKLFVTFTGEKVRNGQKMALIYSPELINAQGELLEALKIQHINPQLVEAARNKLRYWKINDEQIANIEKSASIQETFILYASSSGIVNNKRVNVGDYVKKGETLFDLMNLSNVWVLFDAYEEDLPNISLGDKIEFINPSFPGKVFKTRVSFIDPVINPTTRVASIRTEVSNKMGLLKPEMFVNGSLIKKSSRTKTGALFVPKTAVLWTGKRSVVYVKLQDRTIPSFEYREIEIGNGSGNNYEILSGLETGEEVVTYGSFTIDAASQLNNQTSMMNKNVNVTGGSVDEELPDYTSETPIELKQQLQSLTETYLELKDALVASNPEEVSMKAGELLNSLSKVDMALLKGEAHIYWMTAEGSLRGHGNKIADLTDLDGQREQFNFLSEALIKAVKVFGISDVILYVEHCPMANDNEGANWLSKEREIKNPYFGDKMLKCGSVKDSISSTYRNEVHIN